MLKYDTYIHTILADLTTPVSLFLKLRETYPEIILLESSDYSSKEDSKSFICFEPLVSLIHNKEYELIDNRVGQRCLASQNSAITAIESLLAYIQSNKPNQSSPYNGIFGYTSFDVVQEFENLHFDPTKKNDHIPSLRYDFYRHIIIFDHFNGEMTLLENVPHGFASHLIDIQNIISRQDHQTFAFSLEGEEKANMEDQQFLEIVEKAKRHCQRGDIFQIVLSRRYSQMFYGDEFNVYRALRSINPSPYLFYFDYSSFKIFGSSPEAQLLVNNRMAEIHPIAGTFKRTGDFTADQESASRLLDDPKENAEHIMLVDLARNDLSKHCTNVRVERYKEIQFFSHVIHLVSKVCGDMKPGISAYQIFAETFPAGTLSGAPKHRALQLIDMLEPTSRSYYGGGIGMISLQGDLNHAIVIRSFLSTNGKLHYQSGAGIVIDSIAENELQEVNNKLAALKKALLMACQIH